MTEYHYLAPLQIFTECHGLFACLLIVVRTCVESLAIVSLYRSLHSLVRFFNFISTLSAYHKNQLKSRLIFAFLVAG